MKIIDCTTYYSEDLMLDVRLNILNEHVDKFVIVESKFSHSGKPKKLNFDINNYKKFKNKINYIVVNDTPENIKNPHEGGESLVEQHQRNSIMKGLKKANDNDLVILSDVDEIPNLNKLNQFDKNKYAVFSQKMFMYKLNLQNLNESNWIGSRITKVKYLKSMQDLRNMKFKNYPFWRLDKFNQQIINGGWHFSFLQTPDQILEKIKSFSHGEFNKKNIDVKKIEEKILNNKDIFERGNFLRKVNLDETFPNFISENKDKLLKWII